MNPASEVFELPCAMLSLVPIECQHSTQGNNANKVIAWATTIKQIPVTSQLATSHPNLEERFGVWTVEARDRFVATFAIRIMRYCRI